MKNRRRRSVTNRQKRASSVNDVVGLRMSSSFFVWLLFSIAFIFIEGIKCGEKRLFGNIIVSCVIVLYIYCVYYSRFNKSFLHVYLRLLSDWKIYGTVVYAYISDFRQVDEVIHIFSLLLLYWCKLICDSLLTVVVIDWVLITS